MDQTEMRTHLRYEVAALGNPTDILGMSSRALYKVLHGWCLQFLEDLLGDREVERWLDLGCSNMSLTGQFVRRARKVVGVDASAQALRTGGLRYPQIERHCCVLPNLSGISGPFDVVTALGVLYYLRPPERRLLLEALTTLMRSGSLLIVFYGGQGLDALCESMGFILEREKVESAASHHLDFLFLRFEQRLRGIEGILRLRGDEGWMARFREADWHVKLGESVRRNPAAWRCLLGALRPLRLVSAPLYSSTSLLRLAGVLGKKGFVLRAWRWPGGVVAPRQGGATV